MNLQRLAYLLSTAVITLTWLINGLVCKILNLVPRHQEIVARILGEKYAWHLTKVIGISELFLVIWILSRINKRFCALFQIAIVGLMNIIEFILVPDLLLFGRMNIAFASLFMVVIYFNAFVLSRDRWYSEPV